MVGGVKCCAIERPLHELSCPVENSARIQLDKPYNILIGFLCILLTFCNLFVMNTKPLERSLGTERGSSSGAN